MLISTRIIDKKKSRIYIVMEYCEGGDIGQLIKKCKKDKDFIAEDVIWKIFMQIMLAIAECHLRSEGKILHRDIKPGNFFLDAQNNVKLGDFGLSRILSKEAEYASTHVGTPYYMSPEQIKESVYNEKSDIWSAGCVIYEIAALRPPFEAQNELKLAMKINTGNFDRLPLRYSEELQRVVQWMIKLNPVQRPTATDLLNVPQISLRIKEQKLKDSYNSLRRKEEELSKKLAGLSTQETELSKKQDQLQNKEKQLSQIENSLIQLHNKSSIGSFKTNDISYTTGDPSMDLIKIAGKEDRYLAENINFRNLINNEDCRLVKRLDKICSQPHLIRGHIENRKGGICTAAKAKIIQNRVSRYNNVDVN
jgi:NIMA (never in mitosis gene a)-related kinase